MLGEEAGHPSHHIRIADLRMVAAGTIPRTTSGKLARRACRAEYLAGKFNRQFCQGEAPLFPEPQALAREPVRVPGLDGTGKMGKSEANALLLSDTAEQMWEKLRPAVTDPATSAVPEPSQRPPSAWITGV